MNKQYQLAIDNYDSLINNVKDDASFYYFRGMAYHQSNDYDKALKDYTESLILNPDFAQAHYNRAVIYDGMKKYKDALNDLHEAQRLGFNIDTVYIDELRKKL